ncbi:MAG TPA: hypothetical protein VGI81_07270 [Tepidisphaeraceae bacterium]|jgi:hypothetical protein
MLLRKRQIALIVLLGNLLLLGVASAGLTDDPKPVPKQEPTTKPAPSTQPSTNGPEAEYRAAVRAARVRYCAALVGADEKLLDALDADRKAALKAGNEGEAERLDRCSEAAAARLREDQAALASARAHEPARIVSASFGTGNKWADVTDRVKQLAASSQVGRANAHTLGIDPDPGWRKRLEIVYLEDGERRTFMIDGGNEIRVPGLIPVEPAAQ